MSRKPYFTNPNIKTEHLGSYGLFEKDGNYVICRSVQLFGGSYEWSIYTELNSDASEEEAIEEVLRCIEKEESFGG
jgi:hypothetical protein